MKLVIKRVDFDGFRAGDYVRSSSLGYAYLIVETRGYKDSCPVCCNHNEKIKICYLGGDHCKEHRWFFRGEIEGLRTIARLE